MTTEAQLQAHVLGLASFYGWRGYHPPDNRPSAKTGRVQRVAAGFPDTVLLRGPELIVSELKTDKGRPTPMQVGWLDAFRELGAAIDDLARDLDRAIELLNGVETNRLIRDRDVERITGRARRRIGPTVEGYLWRPRDFDEVNARLARGRARVEPANRPAGSENAS